jgi:hypothetical protein
VAERQAGTVGERMRTGYYADFGPFDGKVWLNCAHQGPLPRVAADEAREAVTWKVRPFELTAERFAGVPARLRRALGRLLGAPSDEIILGNSASYGLPLLAGSLPLREGDEVLLVHGDFPSVLLPWLVLERRASGSATSTRPATSPNRRGSPQPSPPGRASSARPGSTPSRASPATSRRARAGVLMRCCLCNLLGFVALACLMPSAHAGEADDKARAAKVDKLFETWDKPDSPGCALGIVRDGKLVVARGFGMANLDDGAPITAKSVFDVGSMTKSFTCVCLALLMDQGKLSPDDDIRKYVPDLPRYDPPITIRHLVRCEDGLRD